MNLSLESVWLGLWLCSIGSSYGRVRSDFGRLRGALTGLPFGGRIGRCLLTCSGPVEDERAAALIISLANLRL